MSEAELIIAGDQGVEQYVFIETLPDQPANVRDAWVSAQQFWAVQVAGGAGQLAAYLGKVARCVPNPPCPRRARGKPDSVYVLTNQPAPGETAIRWKVALGIVAGQENLCPGPTDPAQFPPGVPVAILDFRQGWVEQNYTQLPQLLASRRYLIRTHDPLYAPGEPSSEVSQVWRKVREACACEGIWFSPHQDMADGALRVTGNWETLHDVLRDYLNADPTLWDEHSGWRHALVIQIYYDGALVLGPGRHETMVTFPGDQPESFSRRKQGTVIGGGIIFLASLAPLLHAETLSHDAVVAQAREGLARARELIRLGYAADAPRTRLVYPRKALQMVTESSGHEYPQIYAPWREGLDEALELLVCDEQSFRKRLVFSLGRLHTCDPDFAEQLLLLRERVERHVKSGNGVLSFAVFGGPGSGKSFVVDQIQESLQASLGDERARLEKKLVNVSQFAGPEHLVQALTEIQALSLQGKIPFVQWDEFDCQYGGAQGGWLSRFLMPMQDAEYWDGRTRRALGKSVFAFVGGTWPTAEAFSKWVDDPLSVPLKGRDFHGRLDRALQIPSVEVPAEGEPPTRGCPRLNRAIALRPSLRRLEYIDRNVAEFLLTARLRHGMRSLKAIIEASSLQRTNHFSCRHLPPRAVLQIHVVEPEIPAEPGEPLAIRH